MTSKRLRLVLLVLLGLGIIIFIAVTMMGLSMLSKKSQKMADLKVQTKTAEAQIASLTGVKKQLDQYKFLNDVVASVIPNDKDQAQAVADLFQTANQSGFLIQNITFPSSTLGTKSTPQSPTGSGPSASTTPPASNAASASAQAAISQAKPVSGISGLYSLELTVTPQTGTAVPASQQVNYSKFIDFLGRVERNRRTAQITAVNIQPLGGQNSLSQAVNFTLTINIFIKP